MGCGCLFCFYPIQSAQKEFYSDYRVAILNPDVVHVQTLCFFFLVARPDMFILNERMLLRVCAGLFLIILFMCPREREFRLSKFSPCFFCYCHLPSCYICTAYWICRCTVLLMATTHLTAIIELYILCNDTKSDLSDLIWSELSKRHIQLFCTPAAFVCTSIPWHVRGFKSQCLRRWNVVLNLWTKVIQFGPKPASTLPLSLRLATQNTCLRVYKLPGGGGRWPTAVHQVFWMKP